MTPLECANSYKTFFFELINNLEPEHHSPGERVLTQNEDVLNDDDEFLEESKIFFILTGNYKVQSLMFDMKHKLKQNREEKLQEKSDQPVKSKAKNLASGDFFGEVSLLFGCKRTSTVKAKQYCECVFLSNRNFQQLLSNHTIFKSYLI